MSTIDRFLTLLNFTTSLDAYCAMCAPYDLPHEALEPGNIYFHILLAGQCTLITDSGHTQTLHPGDFYLLTSGEAHTMRDGDTSHGQRSVYDIDHDGLWHTCNLDGSAPPDMEMLCGFFHTDNPASLALLQQFPQPYCVSLRDHGELDALCAVIRNEALAQSAGSVRVIHHLCEILLLFALRRAGELHVENNMLALLGDPALERVLAHVLADITQNHSTEALADVACLSRATFARRFQKAAGCGVQTFIRSLRMMEAARLLKDSTLPVSHIAERCGYQSDTAFHDNFRAQFGVTPAKYRRECGNKKTQEGE
ncbi:MAG: AraC family transcriptional regulator [Cardiobacteriaceae bacterium]|nr:AraC family transcriptional regulator [Cardiobacteriaceae bacterium]